MLARQQHRTDGPGWSHYQRTRWSHYTGGTHLKWSHAAAGRHDDFARPSAPVLEGLRHVN